MITLDENILRSYGGLNDNSLRHVLHSNEDENDNNNYLNATTHSCYYDTDHLNATLKKHKNSFTIFSTNIESLNAKFDELTVYIDILRETDFEFSAICLQECWINETHLINLDIDGYTCIQQPGNLGRKSGLVIYLNDKYRYDIKCQYNKSLTWEGQFIQIAGDTMNKNIILGNIYRPPRESNDNYSDFFEELKTMLSNYEHTNSELILTGDTNINLLKVNEKEKCGEFFDILTSFSLYLKITLPTRFSQSNGTLIDNIFCKISNKTLDSIAGIILKQFSDHLPCFICINNMHKKKIPKYINITPQTQEAMDNFCTEMKHINLLSKINTNPYSNPNNNYDIIHNCVTEIHKKYFPQKTVKYQKHKHKKSKWITNGIIQSIKNRDKMYKRLRIMNTNGQDYANMKVNINTYNRIIKQSIRKAKTQYYNTCFIRHQNDMKKTWSTINDLIKNKTISSIYPEFFMLDNTKLSDKKDIANKFNEYFINIGPDLAEKIEVNNAKQFEEYLTEPIFSRLQFTNVNDAEIQNIIQNLPSKTSFGFDNLSLKIIKTIKGDLLSPLTIIINQMLNTGIFPEKLKIAKIKPMLKKGENTCFTNYRPISLLPAILKIFERVIYNQLTKYFQNNKLFFSSQYGFRKEHSTELACIEIVDRIIISLDENETPINIYLDLSKAFDTLDHNIVQKRFITRYPKSHAN